MKLDAIVRTYISQIRPNAEAELDWFRQQPTLLAAIEKAALAVNSKGQRHSHQRRLTRPSLERACQVLLDNTRVIANTNSFDELFHLLDTLLRPIEGIGELYIYDTSLRIGAKLGVLPDKVYLHAGTRIGARALGLDHRGDVLDVQTLPRELRRLEPHEIEDLLCIFKDEFEPGDTKSLAKRSWCS